MPAKDTYHRLVKEILERMGWLITHDPLELEWQEQPMAIDLGAETLIGAEYQQRKIAVEVKSFLNPSPITDFYGALGQFIVYRRALGELEPERTLYLALPLLAYERLFGLKPVGQPFVEDGSLYIFVFDPASKEMVLWTPNPLIELPS